MPGKEINSLVQRLFDLGHFRNPAMMTDVTEADLPNLQLHDAPVKVALASFQEIMGGVSDGEVGPETRALFAAPRCGEPDYEMSVTAEEAGRGSWPTNCHSEYPGIHSFAVFFDKTGMPKHWRPVFDEAWLMVRQANADMGIAFFETKNRAKANTIVTWQRGAGWLGLAIVPRSPRCGQTIWAKFDNRYAASFNVEKALHQIFWLTLHEFGHNLGLSHTRGGAMNPTLISGKPRANPWRGDQSESIMKRSFGGIPVDLKIDKPAPPPAPEPPKPDQPKGPNDEWIRGTLDWMRGEEVIESFILIPKPKV